MSRRALLRAVLLGGAVTVASTSCATGSRDDAARPGGESTTETSPTTAPSTGPNRGPSTLLAYFSRPGENYYYGDRINLKIGNTEVLAEMINDRIDCDVYRIEAADPYPDDYADTVDRNVREQDSDARPGIANPLPTLDGYDVVLLASPIWNVRAPMIMTTFTEALDFGGKTVHPVTAHAMSGLGTTAQDYAASCPGTKIGDGLAVQGEEVKDAEPALEAWLRRVDLLPKLTAGTSRS